VPLRFYVSPDRTVTLNDYTADYSQSSALSAAGLQVSGGVQAASTQAVDILEGDIVPLQATIQNSSGADSGLLTAAFFAHAPGWGDWYIGSDFVTNLSAGGSAQLSIDWNTIGFSGNVPVKVVVNPYGRLTESNYDDNVSELTVTVVPAIAEQTISFANPGQRTLGDAPFVLKATATSGLAVSFTSLTTSICTVSGSTVTLVNVGTCTLRATQSGDAQHHPAPSIEQSFVVISTGGPQDIQFAELVDKVIGDPPFALNATASSGLPVAFASLSTEICTVSGSMVTLLQSGTCLIQASQSGNAEYAPAASQIQSFTIAKKTQTILFGSLSDKTFGDDAFSLAATATSGLPVSYVSDTPAVCTLIDNVVTLVGEGQCIIRAIQGGSDIYAAAADVSQSFTVNSSPQSVNVINFGSLPNRLITDSPFELSATASSGLPVSFASLTSATCTLSGKLLTLEATGVCRIRASQSGNEEYPAAAAVERSFTIRDFTKLDQTITFEPLLDKSLDESPFALTATATSNLPVSFNSATPNICAVSGNSVTLMAEGVCIIEAIQEGDATYNPAPIETRSFSVRGNTGPNPGTPTATPIPTGTPQPPTGNDIYLPTVRK
ncbi:MAG: hypothetical protein KDE46_20800, partial [Caldilineaceae bacterium]|nr:hypothetical protein [Caldilineaceae bacterium]